LYYYHQGYCRDQNVGGSLQHNLEMKNKLKNNVIASARSQVTTNLFLFTTKVANCTLRQIKQCRKVLLFLFYFSFSDIYFLYSKKYLYLRGVVFS
jgi:hypothetical protein